jgi:hypothetical protein
MAKKNFSGGLNSLLGRPKQVERPAGGRTKSTKGN